MKVFAHYFKSPETGNEYRWRTLLQFGTSWEVIGSVVMKNPGSAAPLTPDKPIENEKMLCHLRPFCSEYDWFEFDFKKDRTIYRIKELFCAYYETKLGSDLNGVIQIFNLMNVRDPDLEKALIKNKKEVLPFSKTTENDITQLVAPVYLGWGELGKDPLFLDDAKKVFNVVYNELDGKYLREDFKNNIFRHPLSLMLYSKNKPDSKYILHAFCQNTGNPSY